MPDSSKQQMNLMSCPFCGGAASVGRPVFTESDDFFSVACAECRARLGDFRSVHKAERVWNARFISDEMIQAAAESELSKPCEDKGSFLKSPSFFYWLSGALFALNAFFRQPDSHAFVSDPSGLSGVFFVLGLYCLGYGGRRFVNSSSCQEALNSSGQR